MTDRFGAAGYLLEQSVLGSSELDELRGVVEEVAEQVRARAQREGAGPERRLGDGHRIQFSSRAGIQWEWTDEGKDRSTEIRLIEPVDHLHPCFAALFDDPRLTGPARQALGVDSLAPFTSKLNLKRAVEGSEFPWHQDYPYWYVAAGENAADVVTAIVFLDDATQDNGAVRVLPGSHRNGPAPRNPLDPTHFLTDPARLDDQFGLEAEVVIEVPAGSVLWFDAFLVHRSSPNRSGQHRRALLPSWQPAGRPRLHDLPYVPERVHDLP